MTEAYQDLKELRRLLKGATPLDQWKKGRDECIEIGGPYLVQCAYFKTAKDRDFVLAAVNALPTLLHEREALVGENAALWTLARAAIDAVNYAEDWLATNVKEDLPRAWQAKTAAVVEARQALSSIKEKS